MATNELTKVFGRGVVLRWATGMGGVTAELLSLSPVFFFISNVKLVEAKMSLTSSLRSIFTFRFVFMLSDSVMFADSNISWVVACSGADVTWDRDR